MRSLFDDMDAKALELGWTPLGQREPLKVEFRMLQTKHGLELTGEQSNDLFAVWCDVYESRVRDLAGKVDDYMLDIQVERRDLFRFLQRPYLTNKQRDAIKARLYQIALHLTAPYTPHEYKGPLATWESDAA